MIDRIFLVFVVIFVFMILLYTLIVPPWETPDAPSHYLYIRHIVTERRLPVAGDVNQGWEYPATLYEWHHPPLYYLFHSTWISALARQAITEIPSCFEDGESVFFSFGHPSARYNPPEWPWWREYPSYLVVLMLRIIGGVGFGLPVVVLAWVSFMYLLKDRMMGLLPVALLSLQPQFVFVSISIQNDILAILMGSAIWAIMIITIFKDYRVDYYQMLMMGILVGFGAFSKLSIFPVFIIVFLWFVALYLRQRFELWKMLFLLVFPGLLMIAAYSFWGSEHFQALFNYLISVRDGAGTHMSFSQLLYLLTSSFWARMGWMNIHLDSWLYYLLTLFAFIGILRAVYRALNGIWPFDSREMRELFLWMVGGIVIQFAIVLPMFFSIGQPQGRFLFPALLPLTYMISLGWMPNDKKNLFKFYCIVIASLLLVNIFVLSNIWAAYW